MPMIVRRFVAGLKVLILGFQHMNYNRGTRDDSMRVDCKEQFPCLWFVFHKKISDFESAADS